MLGDTIFAVASPGGASARAVLRVSGPDARRVVTQVFAPAVPPERVVVDGRLELGKGSVEAFALSMPAPHSYTGEDVVELHVPGSPRLCAWIGEVLVARGEGRVREARPGEFTARAVQNGKLDLAEAEGVLLLIHGEAEDEAARGLSWLRGGLSAAVADCRARLLDALALVEVSLDFEAGETGEVPSAAADAALVQAEAALAALEREVPAARRGGDLVLVGRSNAGKSSLANAMAGRPAVLVDATRGTTRDVVRVELEGGVSLWDGPGDLDAAEAVDAAALALRDGLLASAAGALLVVDPDELPFPRAGAPSTAGGRLPIPVVAAVFTKGDRRAPTATEIEAVQRAFHLDATVPVLSVSSTRGDGLHELRALLAARSSASTHDACLPVRLAVQRALSAARRASAAGAPELRGQDLHEALAALDGIDGSHGVDDLLDRIYGRFCLGK